MSEIMMERIRENLECLKLKNTLDILDNYLERAVKDKLNIVEVLDHILSEESLYKRRRAYESQVHQHFSLREKPRIKRRKSPAFYNRASGLLAGALCPGSPLRKRWTSSIFLSSLP